MPSIVSILDKSRTILSDLFSPAPEYTYTALPNASTHIRLLHLPVEPWGAYELTIHQLGSTCPRYVALSYTWEAPLSRLAEGHAYSQEDLHTIELFEARRTLDGPGPLFSLRIRRNLREALPYLREELRKDVNGNAIEQCLIWVDAVSINQKSDSERLDQVGIMGKIYGGADRVIVWLGIEDKVAAQAVEFHEKIERAVRALEDRFGEDCLEDRAQWTLAGVQEKLQVQIAPKEWQAYCKFFKDRSWFHRAWVMQEVALARDVLFICGRTDILSDHRRYVMNWNNVRGVQATFSLAVECDLMNMWKDDEDVAAFRAFNRLVHTRDLFDQQLAATAPDQTLRAKLEEDLRIRTGASRENLAYAFLMDYLTRIRPAAAKDDVDKVYAVLGLMDKNFPNWKLDATLRPETEIQAKELFVKIAGLLVEKLPALNSLSMVGEQRLYGLPSWVPDFTVPYDNSVQRLSRRSLFNASKVNTDSPDNLSHRKISGKILELEGGCLGSVEHIEEVPLLLRDRKAALNTAAEFAISATNLAIRHCGQHTSASSVAVSLWRTLTADTDCDFDQGAVQRTCENFLLGLMVSYKTEVGQDDLLTRFMERIRALFSSTDWEAYSARQRAVEAAHLQNRPVQLSCADPVAFFWMTFRHLSRRHSLFLTANGYLGLGSKSLRLGDQIFAIDGARVFFILRSLGTHGHFSLIGDAYMHGLMQGEAIDQVLNVKGQKVRLV